MLNSLQNEITFLQICTASGAIIRLYDSDQDTHTFPRSDIFFEGQVHSACSNLRGYREPFPGILEHTTKVWTDACIILYNEEDCGGFSKRLDPTKANARGSESNWNRMVRSVRLCDHMYGGLDYHLDLFYIDWNTPKFSYRNVCECINIPRSVLISEDSEEFEKPVIDTYGNRFYIFSNFDCKGQRIETHRGKTWSALSLENFHSFLPEFSGSACRRSKLSATVTKFVLTTHIRAENLGSDGLSTTDYVYNNGSGEIIKDYKFETTITESSTIGNTQSLSKFSSFEHNIDVEGSVTAEVEVDLKLTKSKVSASFAKSIADAWETSKTTTDTTSNEYTHSSQKVYEVSQSIHITSCTLYEVRSSAAVLQDVKATYTTYMNVIGELNDKVMTKDEIKRELEMEPGITILGSEGNTVQVTLTGEHTSKIGMSAVVKANGASIADCVPPVTFINATSHKS